jgi:hypothetical protein
MSESSSFSAAAPAPSSPRHSSGTAAATKKPPVVLRHGSSSNGSINNNNNDTNNNIEATSEELDLLFSRPGRLGPHHVRGLSGGGGGITTPTRSRSPSVTRTTLDGSISSIEDYDSDILTDRAGISDELSDSQRNVMLLMKQQFGNRDNCRSEPLLSSTQSGNLPIVLERMTDEALEDIHAFSDITSTSARVSVCSSNYLAGDALLLEPLEEGVDEEEGNEDEVAVTITNLENLNFMLNDKIVEEEEEGDEYGEDKVADNDDDVDIDNDADDAASNQAVAKCSLQQQLDDQCDNEEEAEEETAVAGVAADKS